MRMQSPKLYEHMRKHDILALPGRVFLKRAIQHFQNGFGFNPSIFKGLQEKTKDVDEHSRHSIIVFDEMKLSGHIEFKPSGFIEGFVNPGQFETEGSRKELAHHGLVVVFQPFTGSASSTKSKRTHPVDDTRALHFFPTSRTCLRMLDMLF
ncbi:hypothetical protein HPB51_016265 [Rhipicephalus microplus]|uniref:Transposable element P transposase-like RNase H domain-containing protein n=1 Tax=Rhipicephalus microplus TaxID=6941 RepID=A0A9J6EHL4_RHIMP|nr:hypothetical protein HPB51_016265 [Rhipicephalus microplus]